jgi:prophage regulatory protein
VSRAFFGVAIVGRKRSEDIELNSNLDIGMRLPDKSPEDRLLSIGELQKLMNVSRPTIYRWMAAEGFPKSVALGPQVRRWWKSEVERWIASRRVSEPSA